jgi:hypothetical protein
MKYLKKFNEAIIDWETDNIKSFYEESKSLIDEKKYISRSELNDIGKKQGVEVVDYDTFFSELPESHKETSPPEGIPVFGLVNRKTDKPRLVIQSDKIDNRILDQAYHYLKHENIHVGQISRKSDHIKKGEFMGDVSDKESYFADKDEVMAFAQTISDMIMNFKPRNIEEAKKELKFNHLWNDIKRNIDDKTKKRYLKYIYLYLEKEFEKMGIKDERPAFPKKSNRCEVCGGDGYHKMSCSSQKLTVNIDNSDDKSESDIIKNIEDAYSKFKEGTLSSVEFNKVSNDAITWSFKNGGLNTDLSYKLREMRGIRR